MLCWTEIQITFWMFPYKHPFAYITGQTRGLMYEAVKKCVTWVQQVFFLLPITHVVDLLRSLKYNHEYPPPPPKVAVHGKNGEWLQRFTKDNVGKTSRVFRVMSFMQQITLSGAASRKQIVTQLIRSDLKEDEVMKLSCARVKQSVALQNWERIQFFEDNICWWTWHSKQQLCLVTSLKPICNGMCLLLFMISTLLYLWSFNKKNFQVEHLIIGGTYAARNLHSRARHLPLSVCCTAVLTSAMPWMVPTTSDTIPPSPTLNVTLRPVANLLRHAIAAISLCLCAGTELFKLDGGGVFLFS